MKKEIERLVRFLKSAGYENEAEDIKNKTFTMKVDPLTFAVSQGLLNPSVLSALYEEESEEAREETEEAEAIKSLLESVQNAD